jgi:hypothetical protein
MPPINVDIRFIEGKNEDDDDVHERHFIDTTTETTIQQLKAILQEKFGFETSSQQLSWGAHILGGGTRRADDSRTLGSYGIGDGETITLTILLPGGMSVPW